MQTLQILILILGFSVFVNSQSTEKAILTGIIYDATGAVIVNANVVALSKKGEKFDAVTNDDGIYTLKLPFNLYSTKNADNFRIAKYDIVVDLTNQEFEKFVLKDFNFVPSYIGKMNFDIALNVTNTENCGVAGCPSDVPLFESAKLAVSSKILQRPLEELPKENKSVKRKKGNNK